MKFFLKILFVLLLSFVASVVFSNKVSAYHQCSTHPSSCPICPSSGIPPGRACYTETRCCDHSCINGVVTCSVNNYCGSGYINFSCGCTPNCPSQCGQSNGCGGNCGSSQVGQWTNYWPDGGCDSAPPGGTCGSYQLTQTWWRADACGNVQQFEQAAGCGQGCVECGPSYGAWGACTAPTFTRSRTVSYSCQGAQNQTEACTAQITGTLFDASTVSNCSTIGSLPKISAATVRATSTQNQIGQSFTTTSNASGVYTHSGLRVPDTYALSFENLPAGFDPVPKLSCDGGVSVAVTTQGQAVTRRFGFSRIVDPWFQVMGGDVFGRTGISSNIPSSCASSGTCNNYNVGPTTYTPLIAAGTSGGTAGLAHVLSGTINVGFPAYTNARISQVGSWASSGYSGRNYDYGYFFAKTASLDRANYSGTAKPTGSMNVDNTRNEFMGAGQGSGFTLSSDYGVYLSSGTLTIDGSWSLGPNEKIIILHDGDVNVTGNMDVSNTGSYLGVIASGSITFASNVTQAEGVWVGNTIVIASTGNTATENRFVGEGTFVGWSGVSLNRNRGSNNSALSTELFTFRPDFVYYAPEGMKTSKVIWQELAP